MTELDLGYEIVGECEPPTVAIARRTIGGVAQQILVACEGFGAGDRILMVSGRESKITHRHALQVAEGCHVVAGEPVVDERGRDRYAWRFLSHACDPNSMLRGRELVARREIAAGDELTLNYLASEWDMAEPFACACVHDCGLVPRGPDGERWIRGYRHLTHAQRVRLRNYASAHLVGPRPRFLKALEPG